MTAARVDQPRTWRIAKPAARGRGGVVVSQHVLASEAGARVLADGGNAVDAAVTTALAMGVVEPWLSGIGGGGLMLSYDARSRRVAGLDFGMASPRGLDPARYPVVGRATGKGLFHWPRVEDGRNLEGFESICVPGAVDGLGTALARWGTFSWRRALAPAIGYAREGLLVDWYTTLSIASTSADLRRFPAARRLFMPGGDVPVETDERSAARLSLAPLADTLEALAERGYRDLYEGELARAIVSELEEGGSAITAEDLSAYCSREVPPATVAVAGSTVHAMPGSTGGPTLIAMLEELERTLGPAPGEASEPSPDDHLAVARAIRGAYARRLASMGHAALHDGCTTHVSVIDRDGNMAALTNTLLSRFGSRVVLEGSGILMNNGVMWFDPTPGRPNSIAPGVRPLANMCPVLVTDRDAPRAALGAAGGRRIAPALVQIVSYLLRYRMPAAQAATYPRIDASEDYVLVDEDLEPDAADALAAEFETRVVRRDVFPSRFSVPSVAAVEGHEQVGVAYPEGPWPAAVAA